MANWVEIDPMGVRSGMMLRTTYTNKDGSTLTTTGRVGQILAESKGMVIFSVGEDISLYTDSAAALYEKVIVERDLDFEPDAEVLEKMLKVWAGGDWPHLSEDDRKDGIQLMRELLEVVREND